MKRYKNKLGNKDDKTPKNQVKVSPNSEKEFNLTSANEKYFSDISNANKLDIITNDSRKEQNHCTNVYSDINSTFKVESTSKNLSNVQSNTNGNSDAQGTLRSASKIQTVVNNVSKVRSNIDSTSKIHNSSNSVSKVHNTSNTVSKVQNTSNSVSKVQNTSSSISKRQNNVISDSKAINGSSKTQNAVNNDLMVENVSHKTATENNRTGNSNVSLSVKVVEVTNREPVKNLSVSSVRPVEEKKVYTVGDGNSVADFCSNYSIVGNNNSIYDKTNNVSIKGDFNVVEKHVSNAEVVGLNHHVKTATHNISMFGSHGHGVISGSNLFSTEFEVDGVKKIGKAQVSDFLMIAVVNERGMACLKNSAMDKVLCENIYFPDRDIVALVNLHYVIMNKNGNIMTGIASNTVKILSNGCSEWCRTLFRMDNIENTFPSPIEIVGLNLCKYSNSASIQVHNSEGNGEIEVFTSIKILSLQKRKVEDYGRA